jgi:hypothetical protein
MNNRVTLRTESVVSMVVVSGGERQLVRNRSRSTLFFFWSNKPFNSQVLSLSLIRFIGRYSRQFITWAWAWAWERLLAQIPLGLHWCHIEIFFYRTTLFSCALYVSIQCYLSSWCYKNENILKNDVYYLSSGHY